MLTTKRPGNGISALRIAEVVGRTVVHELEPDHQLEEADLA
jgi:sialic acid synthase SpsE